MDLYSLLVEFVFLIMFIFRPVELKVYSREVIQQDYLNQQCGKYVGGSDASGRLESSHAITYDNQMNCKVTTVVTPKQMTLLLFRRFEFEDQMSGACVDYLNVYDGGSTASARLNAVPLCGNGPGDTFNYTTSSNEVTFEMVTDNNAKYRGFGLLYVAVTKAPCEPASQFACDNGYCIAEKLQCNRVNECGDGSDELVCEEESILNDPGMNIGLIVGCCVAGIILLIIIGIIIYKIYEWYMFQKWLKYQGRYRSDFDYNRQYPVSDVYSRYQEKISGRREPAAGWETAETQERTMVQEMNTVTMSTTTEEYGAINKGFTTNIST